MKIAARIATALLAAAYLTGSAYTVGRVWHRIECPAVDPFTECGERRFWVSIIIGGLWPFAISVVLQDEESK